MERNGRDASRSSRAAPNGSGESDQRAPTLRMRKRPDFVALGAFGVAGMVHVTGFADGVTYPIITSAAVVLAVVGLRIHRPRVTWPWISLLGVGILWTIAGVAREVTTATGDLTSSRSLVPDLFAVPGYLLLGIAVYGFVRQRGPGRDIDAFLDAILLTAGAGLIGHELLIAPTLDLANSSSAARWAIVIYPAISTCLLILAGQLAFSAKELRPGFSFIVAGIASLFIGDLVFALGEVGTLDLPRQILDLPYLGAAALFGSMALNPKMHQIADGYHARHGKGIGLDRLATLPIAMFAPLLIVVTREDGESLWVQASLCSVLAIAAVARLLRAIREQTRLRAELVERATHDELTGLPSRLLILDELAERLPDGAGTVWVLFLDLDEFKVVNDSMGHGAGDELLVLVAERLLASVRPGDIVGRISGDEFVVITSHSSVDGARALGDRIRRQMRPAFALEAGDVFASASVGVAGYEPNDGDDRSYEHLRREAGRLMQRADTAMYRSKERGRNVTTIFDQSMKDSLQARLDLERQLRSALELDQIQVVYQPIVHGTSGRIEGFEALMRWTIDGRSISPADFIPVAEGCGLIVPLGRYVLIEACRQASWWRSNIPGAEDFYVSVNLSPRQVLLSDIVDATHQALREFKLPGSALWLEITESVLMEDTVTTAAVMQALCALDVRLAIDDFGTGFSSLSYLKRFPVSRVKIDRSFVTGLGNDESDSSLVAAIVAMAGAMDLDTVAEGVETSEQAELLTSLGCHHLQGFLFSPAVAAIDVVDVMVRLDGVIRRGAEPPRRCRETESARPRSTSG